MSTDEIKYRVFELAQTIKQQLDGDALQPAEIDEVKRWVACMEKPWLELLKEPGVTVTVDIEDNMTIARAE